MTQCLSIRLGCRLFMSLDVGEPSSIGNPMPYDIGLQHGFCKQ